MDSSGGLSEHLGVVLLMDSSGGLSEHLGLEFRVWKAHIIDEMGLHFIFGHTLNSENLWIFSLGSSKHGFSISCGVDHTVSIDVLSIFEFGVLFIFHFDGLSFECSIFEGEWLSVSSSSIHKVCGVATHFFVSTHII